MNNVKLPYTPSELIKLAIADLERVERLSNYTINMSAWHQYDKAYNICHVCLAGAVIAMSLDGDINIKLGPFDYEEKTCSALYLLNELRVFHNPYMIYRAIKDHRSKYTEEQLQPISTKVFMPIPEYNSDPTGFKEAMLHNARQLAAIGL